MQHYRIPYGICEIENGGELRSLVEKPEYDFLVNTGMYVMEPVALRCIPEDTAFHMTDLIQVLKNQKSQIGVYPISERAWFDIGAWDEYKLSLERLLGGQR